MIYILKDIIDSAKKSLILIDEIEAGLHPYIQRRLSNIMYTVSWKHKKQFVVTTHSPTMLSCFNPRSRKFIEVNDDQYRVIPKISFQAAASKMDSEGYPIVQLYCEDDLAYSLINKVLIDVAQEMPSFEKAVNIIKSGASSEVKQNYERHKKIYDKMRNRVGYAVIFDGDCYHYKEYSEYLEHQKEYVSFIYPHEAPEKFLVRAFLDINRSDSLKAALANENHHDLFDKMVELALATDKNDAFQKCYQCFQKTDHYGEHKRRIKELVSKAVRDFSETV